MEEYQQLRASVKDAKRVFADDTGWRINGEKCCYHIICSIDKVLEDKAGSARAFGETFKTLFKDAKVSHCSSGLMDSFRSDNQASDPVPSDSASGAS